MLDATSWKLNLHWNVLIEWWEFFNGKCFWWRRIGWLFLDFGNSVIFSSVKRRTLNVILNQWISLYRIMNLPGRFKHCPHVNLNQLIVLFLSLICLRFSSWIVHEKNFLKLGAIWATLKTNKLRFDVCLGYMSGRCLYIVIKRIQHTELRIWALSPLFECSNVLIGFESNGDSEHRHWKLIRITVLKLLWIHWKKYSSTAHRAFGTYS